MTINLSNKVKGFAAGIIAGVTIIIARKQKPAQ